MKWRPWFACMTAKTKGDRAWWTNTDKGYQVRPLISLQVVVNKTEDAKILQFILGPFLFNIAAKF